MNIKEQVKRIMEFKYRGKRYVVSEIYGEIPTFTGCYCYMRNIKCCFINGNLSKKEKSLGIHCLISEKKLTAV